MKEGETYLEIILPLGLKWEPCYIAKGEFSPGDRVRVQLGSKEYPGVVSKVGISPDVEADSIQHILGRENLPAIFPAELELWRRIADYYLCSIGEVFKTAYPSGREKAERKKARKTLGGTAGAGRRPTLNDRQTGALMRILEAFDSSRTVLLKSGQERFAIYSELIRRTLEQGQDVLYLTASPEESFDSRALKYDSDATEAERREIARLVRESPDAQFIQGCKNAIFLPWRKLGLIIVDNEQEASYKQEYSNPRFNGRDTALFLAQIHGARILLGSALPSLESWYNVICSKYELVQLPELDSTEAQIIDMRAERRKNGVVGEYYSRILLKRMQEVLEQGEKVLLMLPWTDTDEAEIEARRIFPKAGAKLVFKPLRKASDKEMRKYTLCVLLKAEYLLGRNDFRADERAFREISRLRSCGSEVMIQTARAEHPVFSTGTDVPEQLLKERKEFGLPPYTRDIAVYTPIRKADRQEGVQYRIISGREYFEEHFFLAKDRSLKKKKAEILLSAPSYSIIDVDPL